MKLLVTGANGQVGWELARALMPLGDVIALDRSRCDLSRPEMLAQLVADLAPDVIVNAAAYTAVDRAESEEALATTVNGTAPGELARAAKAAGALLVHYSTDYVFDGTNASPYDEDDPVAPLNAYGRSKLAGETVIRASGCDHLILRTTWVFAARGGNFVRTMLRLGAERETLRVVADQVGAPTWARNIADATALIVAQAQSERQRAEFASGVFNLASRGATSWHGFAEAIFATARARLPDGGVKVRTVEPIPSADYPTPAARPANSCLLPGRLQARFGVVMPRWEDALGRCLDEIFER
ncbi:MAG: dTDP-4-dehydrorhamnose reductase [Aromatoleum sp.]|uniref:dTDP-4-dehydrorhamnose reductase n=1 Tax=Aromatoleum sp. TaxID=2307007 RepID=UPI0028953276|nr:dTDP-4-dehydrorhamnose reductase [Aromatoleum sp.]MDT3672281.1 dTDP-4-dehydrorhamnose reductase [Aromatoleum sp.]